MSGKITSGLTEIKEAYDEQEMWCDCICILTLPKRHRWLGRVLGLPLSVARYLGIGKAKKSQGRGILGKQE